MISRSFERPERTAKRGNDASNRYRMRHIGSQDASASCLVNAHDHILGTHSASSVTTIAAMGAVRAAGGSAGAASLVGVVAGVLAHKTTAGVSLTDVGRFIADAAAKVSTEAPGATERVAAANNRHRS